MGVACYLVRAVQEEDGTVLDVSRHRHEGSLSPCVGGAPL